MMWHIVFAEHGGLAQSRAARSRDSAIHVACELLSQSCDVRRIIEPNGSARSLKGLSWTNILMEADFQACGGILLPLMAKHQPPRERRSLGSLGKFPFVRSLAPAYSNNDNSSLRMSEER